MQFIKTHFHPNITEYFQNDLSDNQQVLRVVHRYTDTQSKKKSLLDRRGECSI